MEDWGRREPRSGTDILVAVLIFENFSANPIALDFDGSETAFPFDNFARYRENLFFFDDCFFAHVGRMDQLAATVKGQI